MAQILRAKQVRNKVGLSNTTIYEKIKRGQFPKPIPLGPRAVGWLESDVDNWLEKCLKMARAVDHAA